MAVCARHVYSDTDRDVAPWTTSLGGEPSLPANENMCVGIMASMSTPLGASGPMSVLSEQVEQRCRQ